MAPGWKTESNVAILAQFCLGTCINMSSHVPGRLSNPPNCLHTFEGADSQLTPRLPGRACCVVLQHCPAVLEFSRAPAPAAGFMMRPESLNCRSPAGTARSSLPLAQSIHYAGCPTSGSRVAQSRDRFSFGSGWYLGSIWFC